MMTNRCDREPFYIKAAAQTKINEIVRADPVRKGTLTIYRCNYCSSYHIRSKGANKNSIKKIASHRQSRECGTKIIFKTKDDAQMKIDELYKNKNVTTYWCRFCHGWHIGHAIGYEHGM